MEKAWIFLAAQLFNFMLTLRNKTTCKLKEILINSRQRSLTLPKSASSSVLKSKRFLYHLLALARDLGERESAPDRLAL